MNRRFTVFGGVLAVLAATFGTTTAMSSSASVSAPWDPYFAAASTVADFGAASKPYGVALGDFNSDGTKDMIVGRSTGNASGLNFAAPSVIYDNATSNGRVWGIATGDFNGDSKTDLVVGRYDGRVYFVPGNGNGTFGTAVDQGWKQTTWNASAFGTMDVNNDGKLDVVWGANTALSGCSVTGSSYNTQATCTAAGYTWKVVNDGDVRAYLGNGNGTFQQDVMYISGVLHNAGVLLAHPGTADAGSLAIGDVDANGSPDIVVGVIDGTNTTVKLLRNNGSGGFTVDSPFISQPTSVSGPTTPIYYPPTSAFQSTPWGLAITDMTGDGKPDVLVADRALYVYLYGNDGSGQFTLRPGNTIPTRGNAILQHDSLRPSTAYTPSLAAGDINLDGRPDIVLGLFSGGQAAAVNSNDGGIFLDVSSGLTAFTQSTTPIGNIGFAPRGVTVLDLNGDGLPDVIGGSYGGKVSKIMQATPSLPDPNVYFATGNGSGGFATPTPLPWNLEAGNSANLTAADVNQDGKPDLVYGAVADGVAGGVVKVADGDVRVLYGNGDGTFALNSYTRTGATYAAGALLGHVGGTGNAASSLAVGDVNGDGWPDVVVGGLDGAGNTIVSLIHNNADGTFTLDSAPLVSQPANSDLQSPVYYPAYQPATTPWGLAIADVTGDGNADVLVLDRALYLYLFAGDGAGHFSMRTGYTWFSNRPNVFLPHDGVRVFGYTGALATGDVNGDNRPDIVIGLQSGAQTSPITNDGGITIDLSTSTPGVFRNSGVVGTLGTQARGVNVADVTGDGYADVVAGSYGGTVGLLRQLAPIDTDSDGISDYIDNAPYDKNAPRLDMNTDGGVTYKDQLDNDFDTDLTKGNIEDPSTWQRLGDPVDPDDDNDGVPDASDNCVFTPNAAQADKDSDGIGNACDPLDNRDPDGDGVPNSILPGDPLYNAAKAAAAKWASASTHFVIRIDSLEHFWQSEFSEILTDAVSAPDVATFRAQCLNDYANGADKISTYRPDCANLDGGKNLSVSLVVIPKQMWDDPTVVGWINNRNDNANLEIGQHGTYHKDSIPVSDVATDPGIVEYGVYSESTGLSFAENYEYLKIGQDTLTGNYDNKWLKESGALPTDPKVDWSTSANPLITYVPPYNTSDTAGRKAMAQLGYLGFSASHWEESGDLAYIFSPEGSHMEQWDQFGMFHASADTQILPPADIGTAGAAYDQRAYDRYLESETNVGGLTTWLVEAPDWTGRDGTTNEPNDTVNVDKFGAWNHLLDFVKNYPDSVAMTLGEVAMAKAFDNAPTVANADQADTNHNGVGDVVEGASLTAAAAHLTRDVAGALQATLKNGAGTPLADQTVTFRLDTDGDGTADAYTATTNGSGVATAAVTVTGPAAKTTFQASWDGSVIDATTSASVTVTDGAALTLDAANPTSGQVTDDVTVRATLTGSKGDPVAGRDVKLTIGSVHDTVTTDSAGVAEATLTLPEPGGSFPVTATFAGDDLYPPTSATAPFSVTAEDTTLALDEPLPSGQVTDNVTIGATLLEADGAPVAGRTIAFAVGGSTATGTTDSSGHATASVALGGTSGTQPVDATFAGDVSYRTANATELSLDVAKEDTTLTLDAAPASGRPGTTITVGAVLTDTDSGQGIADRTVTFDLAGETATGVTDTAGHATADIAVTGSSGDTLTLAASYDGDDAFVGSTDSRDLLAVEYTASLTLDGDNPSNALWGTTVTVGGTLIGEGDVPLSGETVTFTLGSASETGVTDATGYAEASVTVPVGATTLAASFSGNLLYAPASDSSAFTTLRKATSLAFDVDNPTHATWGTTITVGAGLSQAGDGLAGLPVTFTIGSQTQTVDTDTSGYAETTLTVPDGATSLQASYAGSAAYLPTDVSVPFTTDKRASTLTLDPTNPGTAMWGAPLILGATLTDNGDPVANKSVTFTLGSATNTVQTSSTGYALTTLTAPLGATTLQVAFAGDGSYQASNAQAALVVGKRTTTLTLDTSVPSSGDITDPVTVGATLKDVFGNAVSGATITLSVGSVSATRTTDATGHASASLVVAPSSGSQQVRASYAGNTSYLASSTTKAFTAALEATAIQAPATAKPKAAGKGAKASIRVRLVETDNGVVKGVVGKVVRAYSGTSSTVLDTTTTDRDGYATLSISPPASGSLSVQTRFAGDTSYAASVATTVVSR